MSMVLGVWDTPKHTPHWMHDGSEQGALKALNAMWWLSTATLNTNSWSQLVLPSSCPGTISLQHLRSNYLHWNEMDLGLNSTAKLEPFLLMSKNVKGAAAAKLVQDATSAPGVFVFAELLELPNIQEVRTLVLYSWIYFDYSFGWYDVAWDKRATFKVPLITTVIRLQNIQRLPPLRISYIHRLRYPNINCFNYFRTSGWTSSIECGSNHQAQASYISLPLTRSACMFASPINIHDPNSSLYHS